MSRTSYKTKQEVIDTIKAMREFPRYLEKTSESKTAEEVVEEACCVVSEQAPAGWSWNAVARVAKYMVRKNEGAARAFLYC